MKQHLTSINDIAKALGVSASTVSRALKDHPDISQATRERIKAFAEKVNYRPNALALSLKKQVSFTIGIVIPEIIHHFFSSVISGIEEIAYGKGYRVMICQSNEDAKRERTNIQALLDHRVDGLLVCMSKTTSGFSHFADAFNNQVPVVFFDRVCKEIDTDKVITDDFNGARLITSHLIETGCRNILHLGTHPQLDIGQERFQGYLKALYEHDIPYNSQLAIVCDTMDAVSAQTELIKSLLPQIDGIFAVNDSTAIAAMRLAKSLGYKIPENIAVAGFGDDPVAALVDPSLTTAQQKGYEMGMEAMNLLLNRISNPETIHTPRIKVFEPALRKRQSTRF